MAFLDPMSNREPPRGRSRGKLGPEELDLIKSEHDATGEAIRTLNYSIDRMMALSLTVISVVAAFGKNRTVVVALLPIGLFAVVLYTLHLTSELFALGAYKGWLEKRISSYFGKQLVGWETAVVPLRRGRVGMAAVRCLYGLGLLTAAIASVIAVAGLVRTNGAILAIVWIVGLITLVRVTWLAIVDTWNTGKVVTAHLEEIWKPTQLEAQLVESGADGQFWRRFFFGAGTLGHSSRQSS